MVKSIGVRYSTEQVRNPFQQFSLQCNKPLCWNQEPLVSIDYTGFKHKRAFSILPQWADGRSGRGEIGTADTKGGRRFGKVPEKRLRPSIEEITAPLDSCRVFQRRNTSSSARMLFVSYKIIFMLCWNYQLDLSGPTKGTLHSDSIKWTSQSDTHNLHIVSWPR